jgi:hypothetical protein
VVSCKVTRLLEPDVPALLLGEAFAFVQRVYVTETGSPRVDALVALPEFRSVPGLCFFPPCGIMDAEGSARFFRSPNLTGLRRIDVIAGMRPGAAGFRALSSNPALSRLRSFMCPQCRISDSAVVALARSKHLTRLEELDLSSNTIGDVGALALVDRSALPGLRVVDLRANPYITAPARRRLRNRFGAGMQL